MSKAKTDPTQFERLAFEAELREHPGDKTASEAYWDWLQDHGHTRWGAWLIVARAIREGLDCRRLERCNRAMIMCPDWRSQLDRLLRRRFRLGRFMDSKIKIEMGPCVLRWENTAGIWRTWDGELTHAPEDPRFHPAGLSYQATEITFFVPLQWVMGNCPPPDSIV